MRDFYGMRTAVEDQRLAKFALSLRRRRRIDVCKEKKEKRREDRHVWFQDVHAINCGAN